MFRVVPFGRKQSASATEARKDRKRKEEIVLDISEVFARKQNEGKRK